MTATIAELTGLQGDYVASWDSFIGQTKAVELLQIMIASAQLRNEPLGHVFFSGGSGLGKTQLAVLCAQAMGRSVTTISGQLDVTRFRIMLADMEDGDVLLWEEFHLAVAGSRNKVDFLTNFMQDRQVIGPNGILEDAPHITIIATTTEPGKMPEQILSRFRKIELMPYSEVEAVAIAETWVERILDPHKLPYPSADNLQAVARAAVRNPRVMRDIFYAIRDCHLALKGKVWDEKAQTYDMARILDFLQISDDGLNQTAQRYLVLLRFRMGGSAGERPLMDALNEPGGLRPVESALTTLGYLIKTGRGRELSKEGIVRANKLKAAGVAI